MVTPSQETMETDCEWPTIYYSDRNVNNVLQLLMSVQNLKHEAFDAQEDAKQASHAELLYSTATRRVLGSFTFLPNL
jgi:hypothetical protein